MLNEALSASIDEPKLVTLTQELIRYQTVNPPGDEILLAERLAEILSELGLEASVVPFADKRANVVCRVRGSGRRSALVFSGHLDTVPVGTDRWGYGPFSGEIANGRIYGRGAADMKSGVAAMMVAVAAVKNSGIQLHGDLVLALTAGEEVDSIGATHLVKQGLLTDAGALVIAEPTGLDVCIAEKGALWLEVVMKGRAAHGSSPHLGKNAIIPMASFIGSADKFMHNPSSHDLLGKPTMNIATIDGGFKTNVVPDQCRLTIDFRTIPGQDTVQLYETVSSLARAAAEAHEVEWGSKIINEREPVDTSRDDPFVKLFLESTRSVLQTEPAIGSVAYYTDGAVFVPGLQVPMVICGPGEAACAHQVNEWVEIDKLRPAALIYADIALRMLG